MEYGYFGKNMKNGLHYERKGFILISSHENVTENVFGNVSRAFSYQNEEDIT